MYRLILFERVMFENLSSQGFQVENTRTYVMISEHRQWRGLWKMTPYSKHAIRPWFENNHQWGWATSRSELCTDIKYWSKIVSLEDFLAWHCVSHPEIRNKWVRTIIIRSAIEFLELLIDIDVQTCRAYVSKQNFDDFLIPLPTALVGGDTEYLIRWKRTVSVTFK